MLRNTTVVFKRGDTPGCLACTARRSQASTPFKWPPPFHSVRRLPVEKPPMIWLVLLSASLVLRSINGRRCDDCPDTCPLAGCSVTHTMAEVGGSYKDSLTQVRRLLSTPVRCLFGSLLTLSRFSSRRMSCERSLRRSLLMAKEFSPLMSRPVCSCSFLMNCDRSQIWRQS